MTVLTLIFVILLVLALIKISLRKKKTAADDQAIDNVESFDDNIP